METYCISCKKYTANENSSVKKIEQHRAMLLSNCCVCGKKKKLLLKIKNFQMISLKIIKSLTNFC